MPDANTKPSDCTLAILAGGEGSRMGRPKSLLELHGQPILSYLLDHLRWPGPTLLVTSPGRENPPGHERFSREVTDPIAGQGPLRGLLTTLQSISTDALLIATVDMPEVGSPQLQWLLDQLGTHPELLGVMCLNPTNRIEPFPSAFRRTALAAIESHLTAGSASVHGLCQCPGVSALPCPPHWPASVWTNLNRPEDLERWTKGNK